MATWSQPSLFETHLNRRIDSEFFGPAYIEAENRTRQGSTDDLGNLGAFVPGPFGSAFHVKNYDFTSSYRYIRGRDVKPFFLLEDDNRFVPEVDFHRLQKYAVGPNDLMISVVGTLGNVSICTKNDTPAIFSCKSTLFRARIVDPYYLLAFLNCKYGALCLLRRQRGAVQTGLNIEDLRTVPVPRFESVVETQIANKIRFAYKALQDSKKSYGEAQQLLESELGLDKLIFQNPMGYTARFSELESSRRSDAEFFNPELRFLQSEIEKKRSLKSLTEYALILKFSNPPYGSDGVPIITQKHLGKISPDKYGDDLVAKKSWVTSNPLAVLRKNDLLYYSVGAYLGKTNLWLSDDRAVHASFITMLRCHDQTNAGFLQILLNSTYGILQSKCFQSGTSQPYIYPKDIRRFLVPHVPVGLRQTIHNLVLESYEKEEESKKLLEQAKIRVEQLIEGAVKS
jgi:type I restriction enzyme, S subunit